MISCVFCFFTLKLHIWASNSSGIQKWDSGRMGVLWFSTPCSYFSDTIAAKNFIIYSTCVRYHHIVKSFPFTKHILGFLCLFYSIICHWVLMLVEHRFSYSCDFMIGVYTQYQVIFALFCFVKTGHELTMWTKMPVKSWSFCWHSCLCLLSLGMIDVCHYTLPSIYFLESCLLSFLLKVRMIIFMSKFSNIQ